VAEKTFTLTEPVTANGGEKVTEITLRSPKAKELFDFGQPFRIPAEGEFVIQYDVVREYLLRLSGKGGEVLDGLEPADLMDMSIWLCQRVQQAGPDAKN
jgi:hypothetical protein